MPNARDNLIDAALRVYGTDVEKTAGASAWLETVVPEADESGMAELRERFDALDRRGRCIPWRRIYLVLSVVLFACLLMPVDRMTKSESDSLNWMTSMGSKTPLMSLDPSFMRLSAEEWLLLGDPSKPWLEQKKDLWDSEPENPACFVEYATAYYSRHNVLPPDYFETAARLDPENAWFDYYGAAVIGYKSVRKLPNSPEEKEAKRAHRYEVVNRAAYEQALEIFHRANSKPKFVSYEHEMIKRRMAVLPQSTLPERLASTGYLLGMKGAPYLRLLDLSQTISARTYELQQAKDIEGFRVFAGEAKGYILKLSQDEEFNMVNELVTHVSISMISQHVKERAMSLEIADEFPWAAEWYAALEEERLARIATREKKGGMVSFVEEKGSMLVSLHYSPVMKQSLEPPPLTDHDLKPGRLQDYFILSMVGSGGVQLLLAVVAVGFLLFRFRASALVRIMARRVERLLSPVDWCWILCGGVLLPVAVVYALMWFTPLGGWEKGVKMTGKTWFLAQPIPSFVALGLLMVVMPMLVARWRLRRKVAPLGFHGSDVFGWLAVGALLIFATAYEHVWPYWVSFGFGGLALLWLLVVAGIAVFSGPRRLLSRVVASRVMLPVCATGVLVTYASIYGFQSARQYWFERDEISKFSVGEPGLSKYEYRITRQMREGLRELLAKHP